MDQSHSCRVAFGLIFPGCGGLMVDQDFSCHRFSSNAGTLYLSTLVCFFPFFSLLLFSFVGFIFSSLSSFCFISSVVSVSKFI